MQKRCMADFLNIFRVEGMIDTNSVERTKRLMLVGAVYLTDISTMTSLFRTPKITIITGMQMSEAARKPSMFKVAT